MALRSKRAFPKQDQKVLATWAEACARRVLSYFEAECPDDARPRNALVACRAWIRTGVFRMADIREASLAAHAAAKRAGLSPAASLAAHAAGQAVATAHVPEHAFGAAYYALKLAGNLHPEDPHRVIARELYWQTRHLPRSQRPRWATWQSRRLPRLLRPHWEHFLMENRPLFD